MLIIQSLEGTTKLSPKNLEKLYLYKHNDQDEAVKNQMLDQQDFFNDDLYHDIDSIQLRKYFEDQKLIWNYLQTFVKPEKFHQLQDLE